MSWASKDIISLLNADCPPYEQRVYAKRTRLAAREYEEFLEKTGRSVSQVVHGSNEKSLAEFLVSRCTVLLGEITRLLSLLEEHNLRYIRAVSDLERVEHVLSFARALGADEEQIKEDRKAFSRWFDFDAVRERCLRQVSEHEYSIHFYLSRLGGVAASALVAQTTAQGQKDMWDSLNLGKFLVGLLSYEGDSRIRVEAFRGLGKTIRELVPEVQQNRIDAHTIVYVYRFAVDSSQDVWPQCEALSLLEELSLDDFSKALLYRFKEPGDGDDIFVRRRAAALIAKHIDESPAFVEALNLCIKDTSPFVRIGLVQSLPAQSSDKGIAVLQRLALTDEDDKVNAAASFELGRFVNEDSIQAVASIWSDVLRNRHHSLVLRATMEASCQTCEQWLDKGEMVTVIAHAVLPALSELHSSAPDLAIRRFAAQTKERLVLSMDEEAVALKSELALLLSGIKPGKSARIPTRLIKGREELFGRVLSLLAQQDYGVTVKKEIFGYRLYRGVEFEFQYWRMKHELLNPSPDKRQAFRHTIGRKVRGDMLIPSAIMSELTQTKVPGEPLHFSREAGWRSYLPLPGEVLASLGHSIRALPLKTYTAEGITVLTPPKSPFRRLWAAARLMLGFAGYSEMRNWTEKSGFAPNAYSDSLRKMGFSLELREYTPPQSGWESDDSVHRFFPVAIPLLDVEWWIGVREYFFSAYGNSLYELGVFASLILGGFVIHRAFLHRQARRSRKRLPLVIGGWGTRGKSGVERLKAAMFEGRGHSLVSKTTGCEALFLHSYPFGKTHEMFLFRPYDKATIWEHHGLMERAVDLGSEVFLWECMGLTPAYVHTLQRRWSMDDYSTITNTYPDHEDIQGPAGIDIPQVMTNFVPKGGVLVTTEEEMTPIIEDEARKLDTDIRRVSWLETGLLTDDILERFPYSEHPSNIALVLGLAEELGIDRDYALKEMADRVIPDIGVLKAFPVAHVSGRRLQFVNGMSANERFATLANWRRMGFDKTTIETAPEVFVTTIVNNRADRLSRSRMFASIVVEDLAADKHVLIGTNLGGLLGYIKKAFAHVVSNATFSPEEGSPERILADYTSRMRIPISEEQIRKRLNAILHGNSVSDPFPEDIPLSDMPDVKAWVEERCSESSAAGIVAYLEELVSSFSEYRQLRDDLEQSGSQGHKKLEKQFHALLKKWFFAKILVVEDHHATGEEIIKRIVDVTPPGMLNRIMGLQNIKGTGLDFVYRWQAWETCHQNCQAILNGNDKGKRAGLESLFAFREFGQLSEELVLKTLDFGRKDISLQAERYQAIVSYIYSNLTRALKDIRTSLGAEKRRGLMLRGLDALEAFLDAGDAIRRRKKANAIYRDLIDQRVSHERAAEELKSLNQQQKGGWLYDRFISPLGRKIENL